MAEESGPEFLQARTDAARATVLEIAEAIYLLDLTLEKWNAQLKRAQPHRQGRVLIRFQKGDSVEVSGRRIYEVMPVPGRMIQMKSGRWRFLQLRGRDLRKPLEELRVGQTLPSDALVRRILAQMREMLAERRELLAALKVLRSGMAGRLARIRAACERRSLQIIDLSDRVKLDWTEGAAAAEQSIIAQRKARRKALSS